MDQEFCDKIILPCCPSYGTDRQIFNRSIQKYPNRIVYCENVDDVAQAVCFATKHGKTVRIRSGGHNYEGYCIGDDVIVIDTSRFKSKRICRELHTAEIGSGIDNAELYAFLGENGYPFPSGTCPSVSTAGLTQGGGWGHSARIFGLTCDRLIEAEMIDAMGNWLIVNRDFHEDLFWAIRGGGGGNFGVLTSLKYNLPPKLIQVVYIDIRYRQISEETACRFFEAWQQWLDAGDIRFTPNSRIFNSERENFGIYLRGFYYGTLEEVKISLQPFLNIDGAESDFREVTFLEATEIDAAFYPKYELFRFAGRFTDVNFTREKMKSILQLIKERAEGSVFASVALYALGGKVRDVSPRDTAFYYRNANYIIGIETVWENPEAELSNLTWMLPRFQYLKSITAGSYINFPYLCTDRYMSAYYGENANRLSCIKKTYDPHHLFQFPQSIC